MKKFKTYIDKKAEAIIWHPAIAVVTGIGFGILTAYAIIDAMQSKPAAKKDSKTITITIKIKCI